MIKDWAHFLAASGASPATIRTRTGALIALIEHAGVTPGQLTRLHVVAWLARPISPWTRHTYWQSVRRFSEWLREFELDPASDLTKGIPRPKTPEPTAKPIDDLTINRLLNLHLSGRAMIYVRLALFQGLRVHEIAKVRGEDFDLTAGWIMVKGKGGGTKPVPLHPAVRAIALRMPQVGYWFPSPTHLDWCVTARAVSLTVTGALRLAGSPANPHRLRDTAATRVQRTQRDLRVTQAFLRHRNVTSTQKYTAVSDESMRSAVAALEWHEDDEPLTMWGAA